MLALNASAFTVPSLVGPFIAGVLTEQLSWRWVFAVLVPLVPVAALTATLPLRRLDDQAATGEPEQSHLGHRALAGTVLGAGVTLALTAAKLPIASGVSAASVGLLLIG